MYLHCLNYKLEQQFNHRIKPDKNLNWDSHIEMTCKKARADIGAILFYSIYKSLVQPFFDYCSPCMGHLW